MKQTIFYGVLWILGFLVIGGTTAWFCYRAPPQLAVVDMKVLVAQQSQHLVKTHSIKISTRQIQEVSHRLKETLETFAAKHHLILLPKGAVMGGALSDHTDQILSLLEQEETPQ